MSTPACMSSAPWPAPIFFRSTPIGVDNATRHLNTINVWSGECWVVTQQARLGLESCYIRIMLCCSRKAVIRYCSGKRNRIYQLGFIIARGGWYCICRVSMLSIMPALSTLSSSAKSNRSFSVTPRFVTISSKVNLNIRVFSSYLAKVFAKVLKSLMNCATLSIT